VIFPEASIVAKKELLKIPVIGWFLHRYPMILVDRSAGRQALKQMIEEARSAIGEGRKVLIFPQGTRQAVDEPWRSSRRHRCALHQSRHSGVADRA